MSLVKVRRAAQITLPGDIRKALNVEEGDCLEAEIVEGGALLRPVAVINKAQAWNRLERILGKAEYTGSGEALSEDDPNDDQILAAALATGAKIVVNGDDDLLTLQQDEAIRILSGRAFLDELAG